jgi:hypothetical protein
MAIPVSCGGATAVLVAAQQLNVAVVEQLHWFAAPSTPRSFNRSLEELGRSQRQRLDANLTSEQARYEAGSVDRGALACATSSRDLDPKIDEAHRAYGGATATGDAMARFGRAQPPPRGTDFIPVIFPCARQRLPLSAAPTCGWPAFARRVRRPADRCRFYPRLDLDLFARYIPATNIREANQVPQKSDDLVFPSP